MAPAFTTMDAQDASDTTIGGAQDASDTTMKLLDVYRAPIAHSAQRV